MALIPKYHTTAAMFAVDPAESATLAQGMLVGLNSSGYIQKSQGTTVRPIGFLADTVSTSTSYSPYKASLVIGANATEKTTQNRVSDYFNETLGSGLATVYTGTGQFWTDQFKSASSWTIGARAYNFNDTSGLVDSASSSNVEIGIITSGPVVYPSGVPGVDGGSSSDYSMGLESDSNRGFIGVLMQL